MIDLTLSIVSHGHGAMLRNLLSDLDKHPGARGTEVIVTLNIPEAAPRPGDYPNLRMAIVENRVQNGFGANHNAAFRRCRTSWFAVINPDIRLPDDPFPALARACEKSPQAGMVAPLIVDSRGHVEDSVRTNLSPASVLTRRIGAGARSTTIPRIPDDRFYWFAGMFVVFRSAAFKAVGGFDERFFLYCEDYDISARLYLAGYALEFQPDARAVHDAQRDSHRSGRHLRMHLVSLVKVWLSRPFWMITLRTTFGAKRN